MMMKRWYSRKWAKTEIDFSKAIARMEVGLVGIRKLSFNHLKLEIVICMLMDITRY